MTFELFNAKKDHGADGSSILSPHSKGENASHKKRAALCTCIGSDTFKLLCSLCSS